MFGSRYIFLEELHRIVKSGPGTGIGTELDGIQCHLRVEIAAAQKKIGFPVVFHLQECTQLTLDHRLNSSWD